MRSCAKDGSGNPFFGFAGTQCRQIQTRSGKKIVTDSLTLVVAPPGSKAQLTACKKKSRLQNNRDLKYLKMILFAQDATRNHDFLDFRSTFINLRDLCVAHHPFDMVFGNITVTAVDLYGFDRRVHGDL